MWDEMGIFMRDVEEELEGLGHGHEVHWEVVSTRVLRCGFGVALCMSCYGCVDVVG